VTKRSIRFGLNGRSLDIDTDDERTLLWVLRTDFALTGTKYGCGQGFCGACSVLVEGEPVRSCLTALKDVAGKNVLTMIANAVFDATGARLYRLPMTPARIREAITQLSAGRAA